MLTAAQDPFLCLTKAAAAQAAAAAGAQAAIAGGSLVGPKKTGGGGVGSGFRGLLSEMIGNRD